MEEVYIEMLEMLKSSTDFTTTFGNRLYAIYGRENVDFPLAVYTPRPITPITKDAYEYAIEVGFYFGADQFTSCVRFYDQIKTHFENSDFQFEIVSPEFDVELQTNTIIVQLKKIK